MDEYLSIFIGCSWYTITPPFGKDNYIAQITDTEIRHFEFTSIDKKYHRIK
ncbi:MAG TPA: hypothetical protein RWO09_05980 [Ruminococcus sp.]